MRIFSLHNILILGVMMAANGNIMDRLPQPLRQLLGKGTAIAMSEKFDMGAMLEKLRMEQEAVMAQQMPGSAPQPYNFAEGAQRADNLTIQLPPMRVNPDAMTPAAQAEIRQVFAQAIGGYVQSNM